MPKAIVLINTKSDSADLVKDLRNVEGVREARASRGIYNAVAIVQAESLGTVKDIVAKRIQTFDNVKSTLTLTLVEWSVT